MATDGPLSVASHSVVADATARAEQLAQAEGLTLIASSNVSGYKGVSPNNDGKSYVARARLNGTDLALGTFPTAAEAALAYARHLGPARCAEEARKPARKSHVEQLSGFGVPNRAADVGQRDVDEVVSTVESVLAAEGEADGYDDDDAAETPLSVQVISTEPQHAASSSGPTFKRRRIARKDEYEFTMPPSTREVTIPVPEGAVRAVCSITFHFD